MKKNIILILSAAVLVCSCSTYQYTSRETFIDNHNISATPTVVDVEVDYTKRISETSRRCKTQAEALQEAK